MDLRGILDTLDNYQLKAELPPPPDDSDPLLVLAWLHTLTELVEAEKWKVVKEAREDSVSWDRIGAALRMSAGSARQAFRVRINRGEI